MKYLHLLLGAVGVPFLMSSYADAKSEFVSKDIEIQANVNIAVAEAPAIYVNVYRSNISVAWHEATSSFVDANFDYRVDIDTQPGNAHQTHYKVGLRDINLVCLTRTGRYFYSGLDPVRNTGFGQASVAWGNGSVDNITSVGLTGEVRSPAGALSSAYSDFFGRDVPSGSGQVVFQFPLLTREKQEGGADCSGGAVLVVSSEL